MAVDALAASAGGGRRRRGRSLLSSSPRHVLAYLRLSKEEELTGNGLDGQRLAIEAACRTSGYPEPEWIVDDGYSAKNLNRPGMTEALAKLETGGADLLIAARLDRLARSTLDFLSLVSKAGAEGWKIRVLDGDFDTTSPEGEMQLTLLAAFAAFERRRIGQRQQVSVRVKKLNGSYKGFVRSNPDLTARIRQMAADGLSYNRIATILNEEHITSPGGSRWYRATVRGIVQDHYGPSDESAPSNESAPRNETGVQ